ncbi:MAG: sodium/proton-translocating pyrophosphatase, partial [Chloroflexi bacterium]|nr:sodium/proton-translocating pyrophosphatase [Chloroflexota bacterium]
MTVIIIAIVASICALLFAVYLARVVMAHDTGTDAMRSIAAAIQEGASAFLYREYLYIS